MKIIQFSDIHCGHPQDFRPDWLENTINYINETKPDIAICTGDLTDRGKRKDFENVMKYIHQIEVPLVCVPGNHDAKNNGMVFYEEYVGKRTSHVKLPQFKTVVFGVSSPLSDVRDGYLGNYQLHWLAKKMQKYRGWRSIVAMHHHLVQTPDSGRNRDTIWDAGEMLELTQTFGVGMVVMGHRHVPHTYTIGNTVLLYACTCSARKTKSEEPPSCNLISFDEDTLSVDTVSSIDREKIPLFKRVGNETTFTRRRNTRLINLLNNGLYTSLD